MRRAEIQPAASNGLPVYCSKWANPSTHLAHVEQRTSAHHVGDLTEEPIAGWESFWIDLGGEG